MKAMVAPTFYNAYYGRNTNCYAPATIDVTFGNL